MALGTDNRKDYASLRKALFAHYSITRSTYRQKMDQLRRQQGETWTVSGKRYKNLVIKWLDGCETVEDVVELLANHEDDD